MRLSIIIVNYNGERLLADCLRSIDEHAGGLEMEIWVVDNASTDNSLSMLAHDFPNVIILRNERNLGFAAANNQALVQATGDYLLLLNNDTIVHEGAFQRMIDYMDNYQMTGILGPLLLNADGTIQSCGLRFPNVLLAPWRSLRAKLGRTAKKCNESGVEPVLCDAVVGAAMLIRRATLQQVGLMDEGFFFYAEEADWCYRARKAGWTIAILPNARITHLGGQTARREQERFYVERRWSRVRFEWKHYGAFLAQVDVFFIRANIWLLGVLHPRDRQRSDRLRQLFNSRFDTLKSEANTLGFSDVGLP